MQQQLTLTEYIDFYPNRVRDGCSFIELTPPLCILYGKQPFYNVSIIKYENTRARFVKSLSDGGIPYIITNGLQKITFTEKLKENKVLVFTCPADIDAYLHLLNKNPENSIAGTIPDYTYEPHPVEPIHTGDFIYMEDTPQSK